MTVTEQAKDKLRKLRYRSTKSDETGVFRIADVVGSCRTTKPLMQMVTEPEPEDQVEQFEELKIAIAPECQKTLAQANLDYEGGFLGRGLYLQGACGEKCEC